MIKVMPLLVKFYNLYDDLVIRDACFVDDYDYVLFVSHNPLLLSSLMTYHLITMTYHRIVDISNKMGVASRAGIVQSSGSSDFTSVVSGGLILSLFIWLYAFTVCLSTVYGGHRGCDRMVQCSWIYNYLCNQCISPLKFEPRYGEVY